MQQTDEPSPGGVPPAAKSKPLCVKCRLQEATLDSRAQRVCRDCFSKFISGKCVKQVGIIGKDIRNPGTGADSQKKKYVLGLSLGVSSSVLVHLLNENVEYQLAKGRSAPFDLVIVHVDSSSLSSSNGTAETESTLDRYRKRYPRFEFRRVPLSAVLDLDTLDWSTLLLPAPTQEEATPSSPPQPQNEHQLHELFNRLPSSTSRADILRLFTRHLLISTTLQTASHALLLGHTTTALAELTLSETAKGRGFSLPWQVNDGPLAVTHYTKSTTSTSSTTTTTTTTQIQIYHPLRDLLRKELVTYATSLTTPPLVSDLSITLPNQPSSTGTAAPVVSHRDLSIEEVMFRYFAEVEENYPSVVANVARTTGKLVRIMGGGNEAEEDGGRCGVCSMPLDEQGDERWRGELGEDEDERKGVKGRICYGCERSLRG